MSNFEQADGASESIQDGYEMLTGASNSVVEDILMEDLVADEAGISVGPPSISSRVMVSLQLLIYLSNIRCG